MPPKAARGAASTRGARADSSTNASGQFFSNQIVISLNAHFELTHGRHLVSRQTNLTLLQSYGSNAWRIQNYLTEQTAKNVEKSLEDVQNLVTEVNRDRKNFQVRSLVLSLIIRL